MISVRNVRVGGADIISRREIQQVVGMLDTDTVTTHEPTFRHIDRTTEEEA